MWAAARRMAHTAMPLASSRVPSAASAAGSSVLAPLATAPGTSAFDSFQARGLRTNKASGRSNVGRRIGNRQVSPEHWHFIDAKGQVVGRLATEIVRVLTGKHKPTYLPYIDSGDYVVVTNARHVVLTGQKMKEEMAQVPRGLKNAHKEMMERDPEILERLSTACCLRIAWEDAR